MRTIDINITGVAGLRRLVRDAGFDESKVKRDEGGRFSSTNAGKAGREKVAKILADKPNVPEDQRWLSEYATKEYTGSREEVSLKELADYGVLLANKENSSHLRGFQGQMKYKNSEINEIPLDKIIFYQPSVNKGKLEHFAEHYNLDPADIHREGQLKKHDAPAVTLYPDGTITSSDHHRLIASMLRGDRTALARVFTVAGSPGDYRQVKTKKDKSIEKVRGD